MCFSESGSLNESLDFLNPDLKRENPVADAAMFEIVQTSALPISASRLWEFIGNMEGVNAELMPWIMMTTPGPDANFQIAEAPLGQVAFQSWLLVGGFLPIDRHALTLVEVDPPRRFLEISHSLLQRVWRHERILEPLGADQCRITDVVSFAPRLHFLGPLVRIFVGRIFVHRHRRLRSRFGANSANPIKSA